MTRIPILPTILVAAAVAIMIGLGVWQLQRAEWKEKLIADLEASDVTRQASLDCTINAAPDVRAGRNEAGESGYRYLVPCGGSGETRLDIGWSKRPDLLPNVEASGTYAGTYEGVGTSRILVLDTPFAPLQKSALPKAADLPNNHLAYAGQWFFFALVAAIIYIVALRRRRA